MLSVVGWLNVVRVSNCTHVLRDSKQRARCAALCALVLPIMRSYSLVASCTSFVLAGFQSVTSRSVRLHDLRCATAASEMVVLLLDGTLVIALHDQRCGAVASGIVLDGTLVIALHDQR
jgi:hypothetical protein